ncbi:P-loop containing nucleoside triphosphate hydrolase protein [Patellaria atrata CBS 101060]|uniref:P-loop containing nucleoside triphosphate hydrolase protein n=1 Tax=Patellaria atrata CBS 101060 TaxID=1346257 RepID=A0A9P4VMS3_9PEZI|nr:P-loop containing nucleoside triphosphate hydrolase protein [Patellaria atrata CBS 101060]
MAASPEIVPIAGLVLVFLATLPALYNLPQLFFKKNQGYRNIDIYEDKDGVATEETQRIYRKTRLPIFMLNLSTSAGFCVSLVAAAFNTVEGSQHGRSYLLVIWSRFTIWALIHIQATNIYSERNPVSRYEFASFHALSNLILLFVIFLTEDLQTILSGHGSLSIVNFVLSALGFFSAIAFPRRPQLYKDGQEVDGQWTVSAFYHYTYSWCSPVLARAAKQRVLRNEDLPLMDHNTRAKDLAEAWVSMQGKGNLAKLIILAHLSAFAKQYIVTLLSGIFLVAPQFAMYRLLRLLEARSNGEDVNFAAGLWVGGLGLAMIIECFLDNWYWWICYGHLQVPIRVQLAALIFSKSMRRKDVKGASTKTSKEQDSKDTTAVNPSEGVGAVKEDNPEDHIQKTRQGTVNLVGIDAKRIADFASYNNVFFAAAIKISVCFTFLGKLIGWQGLLAGVIVHLLSLPLNIYFSRRYADGQDELMRLRDRKLAVLNEALTGIRQIKFSALERQWQKRIEVVRKEELGAQWKVFKADTILIFCWLIGPIMLSATCLGVYATIHGDLSASIAFTTIGILGQIEGTLGFLPELTTIAIDAWVSVKRIDEYLRSPEKEPNETIPGNNVRFEGASISWPRNEEPDEETFILRDISLSFPCKQLSVISGRTGTGKSLLLAAILGEVEILSGRIIVPRAPSLEERCDYKANKSNWIIDEARAFVSQQPWIENCTFRDNVLFGLPYDASRYQQVIEACAMDKDLKMLTDGDLTEIGANGINLSGGQRWRITLARALYSRAGILIMDDIFSAVDAHVGRHILEHALTGSLAQGRTRILVTHHVSLCLAKTDYQVILGDGQVEHAGPVKELAEAGELDGIFDEVEAVVDEEIDARSGSHSTSRHRRYSAASTKPNMVDDGHAIADGKQQPKKFVEEETKKIGYVSWSTYKEYLNATGGVWFWALAMVSYIGYQGLIMGRSWWITIWTQRYDTRSALLDTTHHRTAFISQLNTNHVHTETKKSDPDLMFYIWIYIGISLALTIEGTLRYLWIFHGSIRASRKLFDNLTHAVLRAPLRWVDTVPVGRVLNRFTADFYVIDSEMANATSFMLYNVLGVVGIILAGFIISPWILIPSAVLLAICVNYALYYLAGARESKRLESIAKSPIFDYFGAALAGVSTIRAFDRTSEYIQNFFTKVDSHGKALFYMWLFNRWLSWRLGIIGALFSICTAALIVSLRKIDASLAGFALGFVLQYSDFVVWVLRQYANVELGMNATERIVEYSQLQTENDGGLDAPAAWPTEGRLEVDNLVVGYAPDLVPVLKGLTFSVNSHERIGVVGRTGAGKSSLTLALFRFLEAREGKVYIDGLDISTIKLHDLRSRLAIIPQDPVLFSGTIRSNVDPFNEHEDQPLLDALQRVQLIPSADTSPTPSAAPSSPSSEEAHRPNTPTKNALLTLHSPIAESGSNLSQGQRQLLCLARAIVSRPKIMVLDEATSAVDKATDELIQRSIREEFGSSTLIVIAHRLSTIADFDRILVMGEGRVLEYGSPGELLEKGGEFAGLVKESGEAEVLRGIILGKGDR